MIRNPEVITGHNQKVSRNKAVNSLCLMNANFKFKLVEIKVAIMHHHQQRSLSFCFSTIIYMKL